MAFPPVDVRAKYREDILYYYPTRTFTENTVGAVEVVEWVEPITPVASVSDSPLNPGEARFNYLSGPAMVVGQTITTSGFANGDYNVVDDTVSVTDGSTFFELTTAPIFAATGTGDFEMIVTTVEEATLGLCYKSIRSHQSGFDIEDELMRQKPGTIEIWTAAEFENLAVAGVITITTDTTIIFRNEATISTTTVFVVTSGDLMLTGNYTEGATLNYSGTGTFLTSLFANDIRVRGRLRLSSSSSGELLDMVGPLTAFEVIDSTIQGWAVLGTANDCTVTFKNTNLVLLSGELTGIDIGLLMNSCVLFGLSEVLVDFFHAQIRGGEGFCQVSNIFATSITANSLFRIHPFQEDGSEFAFTSVDTGDSTIPIMDSGGGSQGIFTAVADASIAATVINTVSDGGSGQARFNFAAGPTVYVDQKVTISGFITNTDYNGDNIITATDSTGYFEVSPLAFGTTEVGSFLSDSVTLTETATVIADGTEINLDTTLATDYDGGAVVYNKLVNSFEVSRPFIATQAGTWDTANIDQRNNKVLAFATILGEDSQKIASAFVNNNATATPAITNNVFQDCEFGTLSEATTTERFKLIDTQIGEFEYTGNEHFHGSITFDFTSTSSGGSTDFRYKWVIDTGGGYADLPDAVEIAIAIGNSLKSTTQTFPVEMNKGDRVKPQITRNSGSSGITTAYSTIYITT